MSCPVGQGVRLDCAEAVPHERDEQVEQQHGDDAHVHHGQHLEVAVQQHAVRGATDVCRLVVPHHVGEEGQQGAVEGPVEGARGGRQRSVAGHHPEGLGEGDHEYAQQEYEVLDVVADLQHHADQRTRGLESSEVVQHVGPQGDGEQAGGDLVRHPVFPVDAAQEHAARVAYDDHQVQPVPHVLEVLPRLVPELVQFRAQVVGVQSQLQRRDRVVQLGVQLYETEEEYVDQSQES
mmetsp:Transcript_20610/g.45857  ORF Transcript_20610/g.45857 Transcript_20610/m.45857 type:complete len:235 (-) Transcript_20610:2423-3127(-)